MILPAKHLPPDRALAGVGADILAHLDDDRTVSELWERVRASRSASATPLSFDWFILSLSMLYTISAIDLTGNLISMRSNA